MKHKIFVMMMALVFAAVAAQAATFESSERQVTLLELYSSEGCSSCPPADDWMREFLKPSNLWKDYVPVVFHVDYWDRLGWKDPFASPQYTERQENYARSWQSSNLFTPNVVINGKNWGQWRRLKTLPTFNQNMGVLKIETQANGKVQILFTPTVAESQGYEVHLALLGFDISSTVPRGENGGKILKHDFVVLDYQRANLEGAGALNASLSLNASDPRAQKLGVAAWVSKKGNSIPVQAAGGYL